MAHDGGMIAPGWLWIVVTIAAAAAQTARNAAQRHLTPVLGTMGATLVRFVYGLPFAVMIFAAVATIGGYTVPPMSLAFVWWVVIGSTSQIVATAWLLRVMQDRNFALGVAYAKTEVIQIGVFGLVFLGDPLTPPMILAIAFSTVGLILLSPLGQHIGQFISGFTSRTALMGLASGAGFGIASIGYRGAALALPTDYPMAAVTTLVVGLALQTVLLGTWMLVKSAPVVVSVLREWRRSLFAGAMGAIASALWFTAFAIEAAANVRTLALIEIFFGYAVSRQLFREHFSRLEIIGMLLLLVGLVVVTLQ